MMPTKPESRALYPPDWPVIRQRILMRAENRCERCGVPNHVTVWRGVIAGIPVWADPEVYSYWNADTGELVYEGNAVGCDDTEGRHVRIVLTIAHLDDPTPSNCDDGNLAALCQRCHNLHDMPMRQANARATRRARKAAGDLFVVSKCPITGELAEHADVLLELANR